MASIITATTTSGLTQSADNSGVLQLASGTGNLVTVPSVTGTAMVSGNMPAFSAYANANQTLSNSTAVKIQLNAEFFDTANAFDSTTNYRFQPTVAGYYQINFSIVYAASASGCAFAIVKKITSDLCSVQVPNNLANGTSAVGSYLVYMNGSTDYLELFGLQTSGGNLATNSTTGTQTYLNGTLARAA
jgi:hypothetical protein